MRELKRKRLVTGGHNNLVEYRRVNNAKEGEDPVCFGDFSLEKIEKDSKCIDEIKSIRDTAEYEDIIRVAAIPRLVNFLFERHASIGEQSRYEQDFNRSTSATAL